MYSLVLDESGVHSESTVVIVAGIAVHESDVRDVEDQITGVLATHLGPLGLDHLLFEAHATELKNPDRGSSRRRREVSPWKQVGEKARIAVYNEMYTTLAGLKAGSDVFPVRVFASIVDRENQSQQKIERHAYENILHRFDQMLIGISERTGTTERGIVVHDRRDGHDRAIQDMASRMQRSLGRRQLSSLVHVPMFVDSRSMRLVQAADFVAYGLYNYYANKVETDAAGLWNLGSRGSAGELLSIMHKSRHFAKRTCQCPPCVSRYPT